jgi:hypothetical protein
LPVYSLTLAVLSVPPGGTPGEAVAQSGPADAGAANASEVPSPTALEAIRSMLDAYEIAREALAADRIADAVGAATRIAAAAKKASKVAPEAVRAHLDGVSVAASRLAGSPADPSDEVRRRFGDVSRPVVALLAAEPSLREGLHVFRCPMAQEYDRWVQKSAKLANPYMGTRMLRCGSSTLWAR